MQLVSRRSKDSQWLCWQVTRVHIPMHGTTCLYCVVPFSASLGCSFKSLACIRKSKTWWDCMACTPVLLFHLLGKIAWKHCFSRYADTCMVFKVFCCQHGVNVLCFTSSRFVYVWDAMTQQLIYKLPGHRGSVNDVDFHPSEPIRKLCSQGSYWCGLLCVLVAHLLMPEHRHRSCLGDWCVYRGMQCCLCFGVKFNDSHLCLV